MSGENRDENRDENHDENHDVDRGVDRVNERWKLKGAAWRVFFYVFGAYAFLTVVGMLGEHAQK
ncbi:hypothetical protein AB0C77_36845 [Streptomyces sp. NPDC048629]|uniref:hypothetical protein n=1 Tax=Streptomyces sp. NPDC048629 TaxID=3154824 RepID=UPI003423C3B1